MLVRLQARVADLLGYTPGVVGRVWAEFIKRGTTAVRACVRERSARRRDVRHAQAPPPTRVVAARRPDGVTNREAIRVFLRAKRAACERLTPQDIGEFLIAQVCVGRARVYGVCVCVCGVCSRADSVCSTRW